MVFKIEFSPAARDHVRGLRKRDQRIILDAIARQLSEQPELSTRNRKRLEANTLAPWELRVGAFRVFYDVKGDPERVVILAVGHKVHNTLYIGGQEIEL